MLAQKKSKVSSFNTPRHASFANGEGEAGHIRVEALFQPDILIPSQFQDTYRRRFNLEPERVLMLAVLEDAVQCFQDHVAATRPKHRVLFQESEEWLLDHNNSYPFSFENICEALGLDPDYLRQGLLRWKDTALANLEGKEYRTRLAS
jgi:hypothetical protein